MRMQCKLPCSTASHRHGQGLIEAVYWFRVVQTRHSRSGRKGPQCNLRCSPKTWSQAGYQQIFIVGLRRQRLTLVAAEVNREKPRSDQPNSQNGSGDQVRCEQPEGSFCWPCCTCAPSGTDQTLSGVQPVLYEYSAYPVRDPSFCHHRPQGACASVQQPAPGPHGSLETPSQLTLTQSESLTSSVAQHQSSVGGTHLAKDLGQFMLLTTI